LTDAVPLTPVVAVVLESVQLAPFAGTGENVTVTPLAGVPLDVTVAISGLVNAVLTVVLCPPPLVAAIEMVGGVELELLQPVRKPKARRTDANARIIV
jgi:hypothetical protein